jgi:uncharacterized phage-associated protein
MHPSTVIANRLLELARAAGDTLTPMQLIKLVFMCHGWMLGLYGRPLIREEVQAWRYGPVIPELYQHVRRYRSGPVTAMLPHHHGRRHLHPLEDDLIQQVYRLYGGLDGVTLSKMTHEAGSPWDQTWQPGAPNLVISNDLIENYYGAMARRAAAN